MFQENPLANIKKIDCALLPPSQQTLRKKILRAQYVANLWRQANTAYPNQHMSPIHYGWSLKAGLLQPTWYDGPAIPESLFRTTADTMAQNDDNTEAEIDETIVQSQEEDEMLPDDAALGESDSLSLSDEEPWSEDSDSDSEETD